MKPILSLALASTLFACGDKDTDSGETANTCDITAAVEHPINDQADVYYRTDVVFELSEADSTASVELVDADGAAVTGDLTLDGAVVTFTPSEALRPSTGYTATLSWCGGDAPISFTTSSLGAPLEADISGLVFAVDPASGVVAEPEGVGDLISGFVGGVVLLEVLSAGSDISFRGTLSEADSTAQDTCLLTQELPAVDFSGTPYFQLDNTDVVIDIGGDTITIGGMSMSGTFLADGSGFGGGTLSGQLDARDMGPLLEDTIDDTSPEAICELLGGLSVDCATCDADGEVFCLDVLIEDIAASSQDDSLEEIDQLDCHEACADSCDNKSCPQAADFGICQQ